MVRLTMSGMIVDARDHVRITVRVLPLWAISTFFMSFGSTYGPFFTDLDIIAFRFYSRLPVVTSSYDHLVRRLFSTRSRAQSGAAPWSLRARHADAVTAFTAAMRVISR
jgi:hypothetical protein